MAKDCSFDIVSEYDQQELTNALDQARRDLATRFDFKNSKSEITQKEDTLVITTDDEFKIRNIIDILSEKFTKRGLSPFLLDDKANEPEHALGGQVRLECPLQAGIDKELAKKITTVIKDELVKEHKLKVSASIQGEEIRVSGKDRDDLQQVIAKLREKSEQWQVPLQFKNFR
jgi:cyclic-di-GMP-binding protein